MAWAQHSASQPVIFCEIMCICAAATFSVSCRQPWPWRSWAMAVRATCGCLCIAQHRQLRQRLPLLPPQGKPEGAAPNYFRGL